MRFPFREIHAFEDAQRNFERLETLWGTFQGFSGAETIEYYGDTGAPDDAAGENGDFYFRADGGSMTTIYQKRAGVWVGLV